MKLQQKLIKIIISITWLVFNLIYSNNVYANNITIISSNSHFNLVHRIESSLYYYQFPLKKQTNNPVNHIVVEDLKKIDQLNNTNLVVAIGAQSLKAILDLQENTQKQIKPPILCTLIRRHIYQELLDQYNLQNQKITAIYIDQQLEKKINLIKEIKLKPKNKADKITIGALIGPQSIEDVGLLTQLATEAGFNLNTIFVNNFENPASVLDTLLDEVDILLALPDRRIYNPHTARGILLTAFHKQVPLIGISKTCVTNGALMAIYSSTKQIAHQTTKEIITFLDNLYKNNVIKLPKPQYPEEHSIAINYQVAKSLNIPIDAEHKIQIS